MLDGGPWGGWGLLRDLRYVVSYYWICRLPRLLLAEECTACVLAAVLASRVRLLSEPAPGKPQHGPQVSQPQLEMSAALVFDPAFFCSVWPLRASVIQRLAAKGRGSAAALLGGVCAYGARRPPTQITKGCSTNSLECPGDYIQISYNRTDVSVNLSVCLYINVGFCPALPGKNQHINKQRGSNPQQAAGAKLRTTNDS